MYFILTAQR